MRFPIVAIASATAVGMLCQCSSPSATSIRNADVVVSVKDQKLGLYKDGHLKTSFKISTSKFGIGDRPGSNYTPLGKHEVVAKIGHGLPAGAVLKSRQWNGEVVRPNAPGRDPIVSRILWLSGMESSNRNAYNRFIYIHGTTEEFRLGTPASYGCVRMAARDVIRVFDSVPIGATVVISRESLPAMEANAVPLPIDKPVPIPPLTPDSKPADPHAPTMPVPVLAQVKPGAAGPLPVLVNKEAKRGAAASTAPVAVLSPTRERQGVSASPVPIPVSEVPAPAPKRRFFGLMGAKAEPPPPAPTPPPVVAAAATPSKKPKPAPAAVSSAPKVTKTSKPGTNKGTPTNTTAKKRPVKKGAAE